ncbi:unnamed protein product [Phytomonas sp. Hart1]|nr:unnamed protein product [Phytomonas sp. Hart1]|eukprot:CCW72142.1 unnamed protein product [Phytomonas sp. isolate Hart1]
MSTAAGKKWVSKRVMEQQHRDSADPNLAPNAPSPTSGVPAIGSKILEDSTISAIRIKETQQSGSPDPEVEVPPSTVFERQEATDALSNFSHNAASSGAEIQAYKLRRDPTFKPLQNSEEFHARLMKDLELASTK